MSADRWTQCPQCDKKRLELKRKLNDVYGKVSLGEYIRLQDELKNLANESEYTLREDYEQGANDGIYEVHYSAHCSKCNFKFKYDFVKDMSL